MTAFTAFELWVTLSVGDPVVLKHLGTSKNPARILGFYGNSGFGFQIVDFEEFVTFA